MNNEYQYRKDLVDSVYDRDEMEECIAINGEIDDSFDMQNIAEALYDKNVRDAVPLNENGDIDSITLLSLSSNYTEDMFSNDLLEIDKIANEKLSEDEHLKVNQCLAAIATIHIERDGDSSDEKEAIDSINEYIREIESTFGNELTPSLQQKIDDLNNFAQAEETFKNEISFEEEARLQMEADERQKILDEKNEKAFERSMERSNKFHEKLNKIEDEIKDFVLGDD